MHCLSHRYHASDTKAIDETYTLHRLAVHNGTYDLTDGKCLHLPWLQKFFIGEKYMKCVSMGYAALQSPNHAGI